jgi:hypothetical protein
MDTSVPCAEVWAAVLLGNDTTTAESAVLEGMLVKMYPIAAS